MSHPPHPQPPRLATTPRHLRAFPFPCRIPPWPMWPEHRLPTNEASPPPGPSRRRPWRPHEATPGTPRCRDGSAPPPAAIPTPPPLAIGTMERQSLWPYTIAAATWHTIRHRTLLLLPLGKHPDRTGRRSNAPRRRGRTTRMTTTMRGATTPPPANRSGRSTPRSPRETRASPRERPPRRRRSTLTTLPSFSFSFFLRTTTTIPRRRCCSRPRQCATTLPDSRATSPTLHCIH
mmetsp:Transcript_43388/g.74019  ORF Transcript_43388/g.74019 Transcript_43388/m.74019 type:complete len:233 (+) Transcript_43388:695-1393(+)